MKGWALRRLYGKQTVTRKRGETTQGDGGIFLFFILLSLPEISCVDAVDDCFSLKKSLFSKVESLRLLLIHFFRKR